MLSATGAVGGLTCPPFLPFLSVPPFLPKLVPEDGLEPSTWRL